MRLINIISKSSVMVILIYLVACSPHSKTEVTLREYKDLTYVIFQTQAADFYFEKEELIKYCNDKNDGEANDFRYLEIIKYISEYHGKPILIPDTLGTKMAIEKDVMLNQSNSIIRIRDQNHPYAYINDYIELSVISFTKNEKIRIYHNTSKMFLSSAIIDEINTSSYGETNITLENDSIIFSVLNWIR
jgi:hypothetical protein